MNYIRARIGDELGWKTDRNLDTGIIKTIKWYLKEVYKERIIVYV